MTTKALPCPFCGSSRIGCHSKKSGRKSGFQCRCLNCGVGQTGSFHPDIEQAVQVWNKRQPADQPTANLNPWEEGVLMAASVLVATHDEPRLAATILKELGLGDSDCSQLDDFDKTSLRKVMSERGITLRGL